MIIRFVTCKVFRIWVISLCGLLCIVRAELTQDERPNVLFIVVDDLNDWIGPLGGNPQSKTPGLDELAKRSFVFTNAHCNAPLCSPSRASIFTGIRPHTSQYYGYRQNSGHTWRKPKKLQSATTLMEYFQAKGYRILGTGKIMHNNHHQDELFHFGNDPESGFGIEYSFGPWPWDGKQKRAHPEMNPPFSSSHMYSITSLSEIPRFIRDGHTFSGWRDGWNGDQPFKYIDECNRDLMSDERSAQWAVNTLNVKSAIPFFMVVGFVRPHVPFIVPQRYFDLHPINEVRLPPGYLDEDLEDVSILPSPMWADLVENYTVEVGVKKAAQGYLASVSFVDEQIRSVIEGLESSPYFDNTIIVVTSDHGFQLFEKRQFGKRTAWERSTRVPLLIHLPGQTERIDVDHPVELVDLYPTLLTLVGIPEGSKNSDLTQNLEGDDLSPYFDDPKTPLSDFEYALTSAFGVNNPNAYSEFPVSIDKLNHTLRSDQFRYIKNHNASEEFYDTQNDPYEWNNLIENQDYIEAIETHRTRLDQILGLGQMKNRKGTLRIK